MNEAAQGNEMTSAEACEVLNAPGSRARGRFRRGAYVMTTAGHRLQVGRDGHYQPLNKSRERARRLRQAQAAAR
jgi:hypothetical protein